MSESVQDVEKLKNTISELSERVVELDDQNKLLKSEKYDLDNSVQELEREKEKLLSIIENLSKGIANKEK